VSFLRLISGNIPLTFFNVAKVMSVAHIASNVAGQPIEPLRAHKRVNKSSAVGLFMTPYLSHIGWMFTSEIFKLSDEGIDVFKS
jgi:hypothetical protein